MAAPLTFLATTMAAADVIPSPGAGLQLEIRRGSAHNRGAAVVRVALSAGGGPPRWIATLPANGGAAYFDFGEGARMANNQALRVALSAAGQVDVNVTDYEVVE